MALLPLHAPILRPQLVELHGPSHFLHPRVRRALSCGSKISETPRALHTRFSYLGAACEEEKADDEYAEPNEELFYRFPLDVIEDREGLAHLDSLGTHWLSCVAVASRVQVPIWHSRPGIKIRALGDCE